MSLMSAAFAKTTMPDNNRMNLTRSALPTDYRGPCRLSACYADSPGRGQGYGSERG